jgi:hypothetical protein
LQIANCKLQIANLKKSKKRYSKAACSNPSTEIELGNQEARKEMIPDFPGFLASSFSR